MKAFQFRLQTKLDISCRQEQVAREELQLIIIERNRIVEELEKMINRLSELEQSIRDSSKRIASFQTMLMKKEFLPVHRKRIREREENLKKAEGHLEKCRKVLLERIKETQTMEKLKEKEWQAYLHEVQLEEQKLIDEIAINRHYRKNLVKNSDVAQ